jgi:hypothetical protein
LKVDFGIAVEYQVDEPSNVLLLLFELVGLGLNAVLGVNKKRHDELNKLLGDGWFADLLSALDDSCDDLKRYLLPAWELKILHQTWVIVHTQNGKAERF